MAAEGTYVLKCNENYDAWLKAVGVPAELAARMNAAKPTLEIIKIANGLTVKTTSGDKTFTNSVIFREDSETDIAGLKYTVNVTETDAGYKGTIKLGSKSGTVAVENTATGFIQIVTVDGVTSKRCYTKQ